MPRRVRIRSALRRARTLITQQHLWLADTAPNGCDRAKLLIGFAGRFSGSELAVLSIETTPCTRSCIGVRPIPKTRGVSLPTLLNDL